MNTTRYLIDAENWVDISLGLGLSSYKAYIIQNISDSEIWYAISDTQPNSEYASHLLWPKNILPFSFNNTVSLWVKAKNSIHKYVTIIITDDLNSLNVNHIDSNAQSLKTVDIPHHEIHSGNSYECGWYNDNVGIATVFSIAFKTPNTDKIFHFIVNANNTSGCLFEFLKDPIITPDTGTDLTVYNRNHESINISGSLNIKTTPSAGFMTLNPTIVSPGSVIRSELIGGGNQKIGGESRGTSERMLAKNTVYAARITGQSAAGHANIHYDWYEHTSKRI